MGTRNQHKYYMQHFGGPRYDYHCNYCGRKITSGELIKSLQPKRKVSRFDGRKISAPATTNRKWSDIPRKISDIDVLRKTSDIDFYDDDVADENGLRKFSNISQLAIAEEDEVQPEGKAKKQVTVQEPEKADEADKDAKSNFSFSTISLRTLLVGTDSIYFRLKKYMSEFYGLMIFCFIGGLSARSGDLLAIASAHGFTIGLLIMAIGHISGGHLNPAVTVGVFINRGISLLDAVIYILCQLLGAFVGGFFVWAVLRKLEYNSIDGGAIWFDVSSTGATSEGQAVVAEICLTFVLVSTVLFTAVDRSDNVLAPLAIGLSVLVDIIAGGSVSGASMNPARSFGPALMHAMASDADSCPETVVCHHPSQIWRLHYVHWVGPVLGGLIAGIFYKFAFTWGKMNDDYFEEQDE